MSIVTATTISIREFARREGVSDTLVHRALKQGRLRKSADGRMDPALVGSGWHAGAPAKQAPKLALQAGAPRRKRGKGGFQPGDLDENWLTLLRDAWPAGVAPFIALEPGVADLDRLTATLEDDQLDDLAEPDVRFEAGTA